MTYQNGPPPEIVFVQGVVVVVVVIRFYIALFSALEQLHCTLVAVFFNLTKTHTEDNTVPWFFVYCFCCCYCCFSVVVVGGGGGGGGGLFVVLVVVVVFCCFLFGVFFLSLSLLLYFFSVPYLIFLQSLINFNVSSGVVLSPNSFKMDTRACVLSPMLTVCSWIIDIQEKERERGREREREFVFINDGNGKSNSQYNLLYIQPSGKQSKTKY